MSNRKQELADNLAATKEHISAIAAEHERPAPQLLVVTKFHPAEDIALLAELGVEDVAENREQEARAKAQELEQLRFHMIGQIQTKKANHVARWATSVHSVDSVKLANALDRGVSLAKERGQRENNLPIFIQVSADGDTSRGGVIREELDEVIESVEAAEHLEFAGLMVVPPLDADAREVFSTVRADVDRLSERLGRQLKLSAGMSADMDAAIAAGTDIVRVGTSIMGKRPVG
ncbi:MULTISPECIES: YggS family pyridoxal phosphate-dependent enzyme [Corynebacterium]|jgi:pyridoxal phosphate enzyme, yggS family|uniref:YggS family pyridoxal phosphate-dependent enzyme n=1 Tax=Corynebacterium TaxID=1716 RepID=UPI001EF6F8FF|nr:MULTISPECIES: YggS family pyridoxal phosphate-dependent enzyme [Corynebacterium]MCG7243942.1 YggS family pyridoxal phosphate-dependent enzyme [Corynebacterium sp. ACRPS]MCG7271929.1 YggS family pyridoxal phosphate-dependent enzyme [Corynebacterium sp. ACRQM]MCG7234134.1 YggS family pyridoxal phosphate-dependent enzyme [Corynebacterium sp. ACRPR]MDK8474168.1 YggS family pyridoxal phosphate-dependent enzyme [Corynebacterium sp. MSK078]MDK8659681.1 YggS family pyridoxal phosphate-dependent enz